MLVAVVVGGVVLVGGVVGGVMLVGGSGRRCNAGRCSGRRYSAGRWCGRSVCVKKRACIIGKVEYLEIIILVKHNDIISQKCIQNNILISTANTL